MLPSKLVWYQYKNGSMGKPAGNIRTFTNVKVMDKKMSNQFYDMPQDATIDTTLSM